MSERKDGGPAFPYQPLGSDGMPEHQASPGLSLRDWFAGQIAASLVRRCVSLSDWYKVPAASYEIADAMLAAREGSGHE